jgi:hypothetical protein
VDDNFEAALKDEEASMEMLCGAIALCVICIFAAWGCM